MSETPRTFKAMLQSKMALWTDDVVRECEQLEREVASLTRLGRHYRAALAVLTAVVVVLGLLLQYERRKANDGWLTITNQGQGTITNLSFHYYSHPTP